MKAKIISLLMLFVLCACDVDNSSISNSVESDLPTSTSESIDSSSPSSEENNGVDSLQLGDADGNGVIDQKDAVKILRYVLFGESIFTEVSDINGDGQITTADALAVRNYYEGTEST